MNGDYIFLSYSHKDIQRIQDIVNSLEKEYCVWYDKNLGAAREYNEEIADQIRNAKIVIAFFSDSYMASPYCRDEIMYARTKGVQILGVLLEDVQMSEGMQLRLGRFQMLSFSDSNTYEKIITNQHIEECKKAKGDVSLLSNLQSVNQETTQKQLPRMLFATDFSGEKIFSDQVKWKKTEGGSLRVPIGLKQDLFTKEIREAYYDTDYGHQFICGSVMSGKSTLLQTIAMQLMNSYGPDVVQLYFIDFGNYMLELFRESPHVGDVMNRNEEDKIYRFFLAMEKEVEERISFFRNGSYNTYTQKFGVDRPLILIVIDGIENFEEEYFTQEKREKAFRKILREGIRAGVLFLCSKGTTGRATYRFRMENVKTTICLGYETHEEYGNAFDYLLLSGDKINNQMENENFDLPGKGMIKNGKQLSVLQTALPIDVAEDYDRYDAIAGYCRKIGQTWTGCCAKPVPTVPKYFSKHMLDQFSEVKKNKGNCKKIPLGLNYYSAEPVFFELKKGFIFPVVANRYVQRIKLMRLLMMEVMQQKWKIIVIDTKGTNEEFVKKNGGIFLMSEEDIYKESWNLLEEVNKRADKRDALISEVQTEIEDEILKEFGPMYLFIDDMRSFYFLLRQPMLEKKKVSDFFFQLFSKGQDIGIYIFIGVESNKGAESSFKLAGFTGMMEDMRENFGPNLFFGEKIEDSRWLDFSFPNNQFFKCKFDKVWENNALIIVEKQSVNEDNVIIVPESNE